VSKHSSQITSTNCNGKKSGQSYRVEHVFEQDPPQVDVCVYSSRSALPCTAASYLKTIRRSANDNANTKND